jgi:hypothetical protein
VVAYSCIGQTLQVVLSLFGPSGDWLCRTHVLLKNLSNSQQMNLLLAMTAVKYLSIFVLKNPVGINAEFWNLFIVLLTAFCKSSDFCPKVM